jgi:hypothetical protein
MPRRPSALPVAFLCSTTLALLSLPGPVWSQDRPRMLPADGEAAFQKEYSRQKTRFDSIKRANEGEKANKDSKEDQTAIDVMAQWFTYRLTWDVNSGYGKVNELMEEFFSQVNNADAEAMRRGNPAFTEMYLKALAQRARDVIQTRQPIAAVNAGRMLARLAKAGSVEAGDACLEAVLDNGKFLEPKAQQGVQYWALQGLGNLLGRWADAAAASAATGAAPPAQPEREAKYVQALAQVIERKPPAGPVAPSAEEVAGMQVFRREAVRALAQYRAPAVADAKGATVKVPSALALLKVVNNDGLSPPARLDEQIEAAVGVARLQSKALALYQPDYAAQQIGYLAVRIASKAQPKDPERFAWKTYAAKLADAVEAMRADVKARQDKEAGPYVEQLLPQVLRVLKDVETSERGDSSNLKNWLDTKPAPHTTLYKGLSDSTVRPFGAEGEPDKPDEGAKKPEEKKPGDKPGDKKPADKPGDKPGDKKTDDKPKKP